MAVVVAAVEKVVGEVMVAAVMVERAVEVLEAVVMVEGV